MMAILNLGLIDIGYFIIHPISPGRFEPLTRNIPSLVEAEVLIWWFNLLPEQRAMQTQRLQDLCMLLVQRYAIDPSLWGTD